MQTLELFLTDKTAVLAVVKDTAEQAERLDWEIPHQHHQVRETMAVLVYLTLQLIQTVAAVVVRALWVVLHRPAALLRVLAGLELLLALLALALPMLAVAVAVEAGLMLARRDLVAVEAEAFQRPAALVEPTSVVAAGAVMEALVAQVVLVL